MWAFFGGVCAGVVLTVVGLAAVFGWLGRSFDETEY